MPKILFDALQKIAKGTGIIFTGTMMELNLGFIGGSAATFFKLRTYFNCCEGKEMRTKAIYEDGILKPLGELDLKDGEEVEIEVKKASVEEFHGKMSMDKEIADEIIGMGIWD